MLDICLQLAQSELRTDFSEFTYTFFDSFLLPGAGRFL